MSKSRNKWTPASIEAEVTKKDLNGDFVYKTKAELFNKNQSCYQAARKQGPEVFQKLCNHMSQPKRGRKPKIKPEPPLKIAS